MGGTMSKHSFLANYCTTTQNISLRKSRCYSDPMTDYFREIFSWSDMLPFEENAFECLGWNAQIWSSASSPAAWGVTWDELSIEMSICATTIGYDRERWNRKQRLPNPTTCDQSGKTYLPQNMAGQHASTENGATQCQSRCKNTDGCNYWSYFKTDKLCHITTG